MENEERKKIIERKMGQKRKSVTEGTEKSDEMKKKQLEEKIKKVSEEEKRGKDIRQTTLEGGAVRAREKK